MGPLIFILVVIGSVCLAVAAVHVVVGKGRPDRTYVWFALAALFAAANAYATALAYNATTPADLNRALKWTILLQGLCWISLVWFISAYASNARRWLAVVVTAGYSVALAIHIASPFGVLFADITEVVRLPLPWGEQFSLARGDPNPWRILADFTTLTLVVYVIDAVVGLARRDQRIQALKLGGVTGLLLVALIHGSLVDLFIVRTPYAISFGFFAAVVIMGLDLAVQAVRASELEQESAARQRSWVQFLDEIQMLVARVDAKGRAAYVNNFFSGALGFSRAELIGRSLVDLIPRGDSATNETSVVTSSGESRSVLWSNVVLSDGHGRDGETLMVGVDMTERRLAEASRDAAIRELEALKQQLEEENLYLREEIRVDGDYEGIVGESDALQYVLHRLEQVAETDTTVLILGETGVGKELIARAIHEKSARSKRSFVRLNCANLPAHLVESELFGHEPGAFTGATGRREGRFELADGGTIFLDEIAELPLELQGKLLRVLQEGEFERVGSSKTHRADARVLAATNVDLAREVQDGRFRADLYYRINVYPITVPPLRQRPEDIPLLVNHFVQRIASRNGIEIEEVPASVLRQLVGYDWPGNVRELRNVLERAVITSPGPELRLPEALAAKPTQQRAQETLRDVRLRSLEDVERQHILAVLRATGGRIAGTGGAAEVLGLHPNTLRSRMKKLGIPRGAGRETADST